MKDRIIKKFDSYVYQESIGPSAHLDKSTISVMYCVLLYRNNNFILAYSNAITNAA